MFLALSRERGGAARRPADSYRLVMLLGSSIGTLVLALAPVGLQAIGVADALVWQSAAALAALALGTLILVATRWRARYREQIREGEQPLAAAGVAATGWLVFLSQLAAAAGLFGPRTFGAFLCGLIYMTAFGAYLFARMLFLWRS